MTETKQKRKPRKYTDEFKQQLVDLIKANAHKYSVSAMCRVLLVNRSTYYYEAKQTPGDSELSSEITEIFKASRNNYGTRKIKKELMKTGNVLARQFQDREIIGYSAGEHKTAELVKEAFQSVEGSLQDIHLFHTDRGNEFKNQTIEELLEAFDIERSLRRCRRFCSEARPSP